MILTDTGPKTIKAIRNPPDPEFKRLEAVHCNLCGSTRLRPVYEMPDVKYFPTEWFTVVKCEHCGLGFVNPRPTREEMGCYYPADYYGTFKSDIDFHMGRYETEASYLEGIGTPDRRVLLDVGCAAGDFPRFMRKLGWSVEGVEVSSNTEAVSDFRIYRQEFPKIPVSGATYDAITAWAVLEHVHDPMAYFRKAAETLKAGGRFVFLVTNFRSLASRALFLEDIPRHLYFFTQATVKRYLELVGLQLERAEYGPDIYAWAPTNWLRYYLCRFSGRRLEWETLPRQKCRYCREQISAGQHLRYYLRHRHALLDRIEKALTPWYVKAQVFARTHGIVTYVAHKPRASQG